MTALIASGVWLVFFGIYLISTPGTFYFEDSPELMASSIILGNSHPPGYSLMMLLGRLFMLIPAGSPAFRFNLMSVATGAGAASALGGFTASLVKRWTGQNVSIAIGIFAAGIWGLSDAFWWQAVIGDKYPLFYLLFICLIWASWAICCAPEKTTSRYFALTGLLIGISFTHHYYSFFALPAFLLILARRQDHSPIRAVIMAVFFIVLPLSLKVIYPPVRSVTGVHIDWGHPRNIARLGRYLEVRLFTREFLSRPVDGTKSALKVRGKLFLRLLSEDIPLPLLIGVPAGIYAMTQVSVFATTAIACCIFVTSIFCFNFIGEVIRWYEPLFALFSALSAIGIGWIVFIVGRFRKIPINALVIVIVLAGPIWQFMRGANRNMISGFYGAHDIARNILHSLPPNSIYLGVGDIDLFPMWVLRYIYQERSDVDAIGMGGFVIDDEAGTGPQENVLRELKINSRGDKAIFDILSSKKKPIMVPNADYPPDIQNTFPILNMSRCYGLTARLHDYWDAEGSYFETRKTIRCYTLRGLSYKHVGAINDLERLRDEIARTAFLHYSLCMYGIGARLYDAGMADEAAWVLAKSVRLISPLVGKVELMPDVESKDSITRAHIYRANFIMCIRKMAETYEANGIIDKEGALRSILSGMAP